jgi:hypothetical protein
MGTTCNCLHAEAADLVCICADDSRGGTLRELAELAAYRDIDAALVAYRQLAGKAVR